MLNLPLGRIQHLIVSEDVKRDPESIPPEVEIVQDDMLRRQLSC